MVVDNASAHDSLNLPDGIEIYCLLPNITSVYQLMDRGVSRQWKVGYRCFMLRIILFDISNRTERRRVNAGKTPGHSGLLDGYGPNILDVCQLVKQSWDEIESVPIARCWTKARCLNCIHEIDLKQDCGHVSKKENSDEVHNVVQLLQDLNVSSNGTINEDEIAENVNK